MQSDVVSAGILSTVQGSDHCPITLTLKPQSASYRLLCRELRSFRCLQTCCLSLTRRPCAPSTCPSFSRHSRSSTHSSREQSLAPPRRALILTRSLLPMLLLALLGLLRWKQTASWVQGTIRRRPP